MTAGCVLHSTRGGASTPDQEFTGTLGWFATPASQVSAHTVIALDGTLAYVVDDNLQAWHCRAANASFLGVELVQAHLGDPFSQAQFRTLGWWLKQMHGKYGFPLDTAHLPFHSERPEGITDGKTDAIPRDDVAAKAVFRNALQVFL